MDFDVIVIGSGFGGAITGCRLAQAGCKVLILERGRRWNKNNYPRELKDPWFFDNDNPERASGWVDFRRFENMSVVAGAGVGGGSLIYADVFTTPPESVFAKGWPPEITYNELRPYFDTTAAVMNIQ